MECKFAIKYGDKRLYLKKNVSASYFICENDVPAHENDHPGNKTSR